MAMTPVGAGAPARLLLVEPPLGLALALAALVADMDADIMEPDIDPDMDVMADDMDSDIMDPDMDMDADMSLAELASALAAFVAMLLIWLPAPLAILPSEMMPSRLAMAISWL